MQIKNILSKLMGQAQNSGDGVKAANGIFFSPGEAV
jgi:hypothetical protein